MRTCKICVLKLGFNLSCKDRIFNTDEEFYNHIENVHGQVVIREGESEEQAVERCAKKGIVSDISKCACGDCIAARARIRFNL